MNLAAVNITGTVMETLTKFGPASADVIARICHVEHVDLIVSACESMCSAGTIVSNRLQVGILEYRPTPEGDLIKYSEPTNSKLVIFKEVKVRELSNRLRRNMVKDILLNQPVDFMLCVYQILELVQTPLYATMFVPPMGMTELHSILYGLLLDEELILCGPLFGRVINKITTEQNN
jgi:hypothetical protein